MNKLYYSISEVSEILEIPVSKVRFWANTFSKKINPSRTTKGNRQFTQEDIETLRNIRFLVEERGLTLDGVKRELRSGNTSADKTVKALESLKTIRAQLMEIKASL